MRETITIADPPASGTELSRLLTDVTARVAALALREPEPEADLAGSLPDLAGSLPDLADVLAMLAAGRFDLVRPLLRPGSGPLLPLLLARYVAWTGDLATAAAAWQHARPAVLQALEQTHARAPAAAGAAAAPGAPAPPALESMSDGALVATAGLFAGVERLAVDVGDPQLAASLHAAARRARQALAGRELAEPAAVLAAALQLLESVPPSATWPQRAAPSPDTPRSPDTPKDADAAASSPQAAALSVLAFVHGTLGLDPDATRHRLRLRPYVPLWSDRVQVRDIGFADGTVALDVTRADDGIVLTIRQDSGAIPTTVLLEPVLTVELQLAGASVDGRPAQLSPRPAAGGLMVPVQLVLDAQRELKLQLDAQRPPS